MQYQHKKTAVGFTPHGWFIIVIRLYQQVLPHALVSEPVVCR